MRALKQLVLSLALVLAFAARVPAQDLPLAKPAEVGLSAERLDRVTGWLREQSEKNTMPGAALMIVRNGKVAYFETVGLLDPETKAPMRKDAIFRIYSMSKPITTAAVMMLFEQGKITLDEPIAKYIPAFKDMKVGVETKGEDGKPKLELVAAKKPITIQDLLRHTSGITYGFFGDLLVKKAYVDANVYEGDFDNAEFAERIAKLPLAFQPGTTWDYSNSTDILGRLVEVVSGKPLLQFEKENILDPLGMTDTSFYVSDPAKHARIAEPFKDDRTIGVGVVVNDPRLTRKWESGGGGMVSTVTDYARFLSMLSNGGTLNGKRYLGPKTLAYMTSDQLGSVIVPGPYYLPGPGYGFGLGFAVRKEEGVALTPRLGRRLQLGRRGRNLFLGRSQGEHVRRLWDAVAAQPHSRPAGAARHGLQRNRQTGVADADGLAVHPPVAVGRCGASALSRRVIYIYKPARIGLGGPAA